MSIAENYLDFNNLLKFKDADLMSIIKTLASPNSYVPNLEQFLDVAEDFIIKRFDCGPLKITKGDNSYFNLKISNFSFESSKISKHMDEINKLLKKDKDLKMDSDKYDWNNMTYQNEFNYYVDDEGVSIDASMLFRVLIKCANGDRAQISILMELILPLFREIPCAVRMVKLLLAIAKGQKSELIGHTFSLIRYIIMSKVQSKIEKKVKEIGEEAFKSEQLDEYKDQIKQYSLNVLCVDSIMCIIET